MSNRRAQVGIRKKLTREVVRVPAAVRGTASIEVRSSLFDISDGAYHGKCFDVIRPIYGLFLLEPDISVHGCLDIEIVLCEHDVFKISRKKYIGCSMSGY